ncbi:MAG: hypothetical protein PHQ14_06250 [Chromatiales bacterium]|jgi:predicted transcriptional regulator|nr:hypothetical protein [Chromatiales bacterium]
MTKKRILHIEVSTLEESLQQFADAWRAAETGRPAPAHHAVGFENLPRLLSALTPKRWELIRVLRAEGPMTAYALAKLLRRDHKNIYADVAALESFGIVTRTAEGRIEVPWDEIDAKFRLAA